MLGIAASSIVSFINKRDFRALSKMFPSYGAVFGAVYNKKNPNLSKSLIYGSILGFFYWPRKLTIEQNGPIILTTPQGS